MKATDTTRLALQALRRYPLRSAMLLLAISIGVAAVVSLTAVAEGARRYVTGEFASLGTNLLIALPGRSETAGAGLQGMLIGETARLSFHAVNETVTPAQARAGRAPLGYKIYQGFDRSEGEYLLRESPVVRGDELTDRLP